MPAGSEVDRFLMSAATIWKSVDSVKKNAEPLTRGAEAFEKATQAWAGTLPAYDSNLEKVRAYIATLKDKCMELARKDENYWMERSDLNLLNPSTKLAAQRQFDAWIQNFTQLRTLIQQFLPVVQGGARLAANPAIIGLRAAKDETSLVGLDAIALQQMVGDLNYTVTRIDAILPRLRNCRVAAMR